MASSGGSQCEACGDGFCLWQPAVTSKCAHTFHLRRVFGSAACPVCAARWSDAPATGPAPAPATPFSFAPASPSSTGLLGAPPTSRMPNPFSSLTLPADVFSSAPAPPPPPSSTGLLGQTAAAAASSFSQPGLFGQPSTSSTQNAFSFSFSGAQPASPPSPLSTNTPTPFSFSPFSSPFPFDASFGPQPPSADTARPVFNDDEPVQRPLDGRDTPQRQAANDGVLVLKTHCEHQAVARDTALDSFAVLVHAKGPATAAEASERAPLDLVTVLDVSDSMSGSKLALLKQAMGFVIDHLGPSDRLSIVTFSCKARRIIRLTRMSDGGKVSAKRAVESLATTGTTNIGDGLLVAAEVLDGRRHRNAVASVILLSDGQDNHTLGPLGLGCYGLAGYSKCYGDLVPQFFRRSKDNRCPPVHTFGFGTAHDAAAMHAIAEMSGGTFSFIENQAVVQDSFAQCIGGLLSVAVQEARIAVECLHPGVRVRTVKSGRYESHVDADGRAASVDVGELYAEEERCFLLFLDVPVAAGDGDEDGGVTPLIKVSGTYKDAATGRSVDVTCEDTSVQRPVVVSDTEPCVEVARELFRVEAAEDIAAARAAAERDEHARAAQILDSRREASAAAGLASDERCAELVAELRELSARVADRREYEQTGRACLLAGMSSHAQQRASTVQLFGSAAPPASMFGATPSIGSPFGGFGQQQGSAFSFGATAGASSSTPFASLPAFGAAAPVPAPRFGFGFATPAMQSMVESSRKAREQQQSEPGGSLLDPK